MKQSVVFMNYLYSILNNSSIVKPYIFIVELWTVAVRIGDISYRIAFPIGIYVPIFSPYNEIFISWTMSTLFSSVGPIRSFKSEIKSKSFLSTAVSI